MKAGRGALYYGAQAVVGALALASVPAIHGTPLRVPVTYSRDGVLMTVYAKAIAEDGFFRAAHIGAPFGVDLADWPFGTWLPLGTIALLVRLLGEAGAAINLYWMGTILAASLSATWCLRRLRIRPGLAFVLGTLYGFQPYVFYRNVEHVNLTFPFVPFLALLALRVAGARAGDEDRRERAVTLAACAAQGFSYVYYTFFACVLLVAAGTLGWLRTGRAAAARRAAVAIAVLVAGTTVTLAPSLAYWGAHGRNRFLEYKFARETDKFGMKLRQLVVPITDHPVAPLRAAALAVERATFPDENENASARLGSVGALGFAALLAFALARAGGLRPGRDDDLDAPAALSLLVFLVSTVGGLASLFSVFVSPDVRAYNRFVVFLSFYCLLFAGTLLQRGVARWRLVPALSPAVRRTALAGLLVAGLLDEVPMLRLAEIRADSAARFDEERGLVREIEGRLSPGAMVFQLPHMTIPVDRNTRPPMVYYDPGRAYVHSRQLRWSWGSMIGRTNGWACRVAAQPPAEMALALATAGFEGLWIDRWGYTGVHRPRFDEIERELDALVDGKITSRERRYVFYDLRPERERLRRERGDAALERDRLDLLSNPPPVAGQWTCVADNGPLRAGPRP
jgi:phosphoglycerol transferase